MDDDIYSLRSAKLIKSRYGQRVHCQVQYAGSLGLRLSLAVTSVITIRPLVTPTRTGEGEGLRETS